MLVLPAELTHAHARAALDLLLRTARAEDGTTPCLVDATALTRFDSSALAVLLALRRACLLDGRPCLVRGLAPRLRTLATLYGVSALLPDEAAASPPQGAEAA